MNSIIVLHLSRKQVPELQERLQYLGYCKIDTSDTLGDLPINDILVFIATIIGTGGVTTIINKLIDYKKKNIKVETSEDSIKIDCTNATTSEVLDLLEKLYDLQNKN